MSPRLPFGWHEGSDTLHVWMTGSEWYGTARGGLSRYFSDLYGALSLRSDVQVDAWAFGEPDNGANTWGPAIGGTFARYRSARTSPPPTADVVDRHFALYGPPPPRNAVLVTHFHGPWAMESAAAGEPAINVAIKRLIERARYRSSDRFIVLSRQFADVLVGSYGVSPEAISVIPPGVDLQRFAPSALPDCPPRVLCVRRLERRMGIDILLDAWPKVLASVPDAQLDIVGKGSVSIELADQIETLSIGRSVTMHGEVTEEQLRDAYRAATVTVVPSRALEGFGLIALESLASGRAPIVTDVGGLPDSVRGLAPDLVVPACDPEQLATRLIAALRGERPGVDDCRAHAETFSWETCAAAHLDVYRELVR